MANCWEGKSLHFNPPTIGSDPAVRDIYGDPSESSVSLLTCIRLLDRFVFQTNSPKTVCNSSEPDAARRQQSFIRPLVRVLKPRTQW